MDINTITIIVSIIVFGFLLERRINSRISELRQEMYRLFEEQGAKVTAMQADISDLQKGQARIEGAMEIIKDLFERAMFSNSART